MSLSFPFRTDRSPRSPLLLLAVAVFCAGCATTSAPPEPTAPAASILRQAQRQHSDERAIGLYLDAAQSALPFVTDHTSSLATRSVAANIYDTAMAECAVALKKHNNLASGGTFPGAQTTYRLRVAPARGDITRDPAIFQKLLISSKIFRKHLTENIVRTGLGGTLVGVIDSKDKVPNRAIGGFAMPLTAVADFGAEQGGETPVDLAFYNPEQKDTVTLSGATLPLAGDFTGPLAYFPRKNAVVFGAVSMILSDKVAQREGIYFLQPFDPDKIPILFNHGLMSSPHAFINFVNDLNANPEFRRRYQPWVLFYPSGGPIAANAARLRMQLADIAKRYPLKRNLVVVGHSMGGLLTKMQVTDSKRVLWDEVFHSHADRLYRKLPPTSLLKRALVFTPNPYISRVIFFSTPHRGSRLADLRISEIAGRLIRMPAQFVKEFDPQMRSLVHDIDPRLRSIPSSIMGLSPANPLLKGLDKLEIAVPYYSVVGNLGKDDQPLKDSTDGIVPYWSSHLDGAQSETVVPTGHDSFDHPKSVAELLSILGCEDKTAGR